MNFIKNYKKKTKNYFNKIIKKKLLIKKINILSKNLKN